MTQRAKDRTYSPLFVWFQGLFINSTTDFGGFTAIGHGSCGAMSLWVKKIELHVNQ